MIFFSCGCRCDCLCGCVGVALTVNVKAVEGRNISNVCALKQSQKPYFMMFYYVLLRFLSVYTYVCYVELFVFFIVEFE